ncbi:short-chain fatty acid transporter [Ammoniphilus resinae]|uniref:Short-chain fatty acids transporter n=1 Tax=Ammoniphilus resinae TaxID=861532 RepID=A0ABS4GWQ0_9BACL|nr:TIGR00366 family protein [Ammoniphilus resinae]MBP1934527.1 short-chain fatty acids transporter [Ammoniphilus resinae]
MSVAKVLTGKEEVTQETWLQTFTNKFSNFLHRFLPEPFVFAILLTFIIFVMGITIEHKSVGEMAGYWSEGFWNLLSFTMQMVMMVVTGYALAQSAPIRRLLNGIAGRVKTVRGAIVTATLVGLVASYLNWGFGLIVGTLMAQQLAKQVRGTHYPVLVSSAYVGWILYGIGISATIPLTIATPGNPFEASMGLIPLANTIFQPGVLIALVILAITLPLVNILIHPRASNVQEIKHHDFSEERLVPAKGEDQTPAQKLEHSKVLALLVVLFGVAYLYHHFVVKQGSLDINSVNSIFLFLGILFHGSLKNYILAINDSVKTAGGMVLQFPFYAGIMGMMAGSGIVVTISDWFVSFSNAQTLHFWGFISSFFINFFVPSSGGHWAVQGPFMVEAAKTLGADLGKMSTAVQMGSSWNDLVNPFWLLPVIALSKLSARQIMTYTLIPFLYMGIVFGITVLIW